MAKACELEDIPVNCVYYWKGRNVDNFAERFYSAVQDRGIALADQILTIADECPIRDVDIRRAALQMRARQIHLEKVNPRVFERVKMDDEADESATNVQVVDFLKSWQEKQKAS